MRSRNSSNDCSRYGWMSVTRMMRSDNELCSRSNMTRHYFGQSQKKRYVWISVTRWSHARWLQLVGSASFARPISAPYRTTELDPLLPTIHGKKKIIHLKIRHVYTEDIKARKLWGPRRFEPMKCRKTNSCKFIPLYLRGMTVKVLEKRSGW